MARVGFFIVVIGLSIEMFTMFISPRTYALFAWIPFLRRSTLLTPRSATAGYRETHAPALQLSGLGLDGFRYEDSETVGGFTDGLGWLRLRYKFWSWNRVMGVIIISASVDGHTLQLRTRMLPASTLTMAPIVFMSPNVQFALLFLLVLGVVCGVSVWMMRQRAEQSLTQFLDALEVRAQRTVDRG